MVIYLDFDGVLHPDAVYTHRNEPLVLRAPGELFMHAHALQECLAPYPEAKIVLSTNWVRFLGYERTLKKMPAKFAKRVIDATWHESMLNNEEDPGSWMKRFQQIEFHVERTSVKRWLAIDDLHSGSESWPQDMLHRLVLTEQSKGLGCLNAQADLNTKLMEIQYS